MLPLIMQSTYSVIRQDTLQPSLWLNTVPQRDVSSYARIDDTWLFTRRRHLLVYGAMRDENPLPLAPANWPQSATGMGTVPHDLETWKEFWSREPGSS